MDSQSCADRIVAQIGLVVAEHHIFGPQDALLLACGRTHRVECNCMLRNPSWQASCSGEQSGMTGWDS